MTVFIIDDEPLGRDSIRLLLNQYFPNIEIVGECDSIKSSIQQIRKLKPDMLFLDINLPGESGFDLFLYFENPIFETIIVTAHNEFALKAIHNRVLYYIVKPIEFVEFDRAVNLAAAAVEAKKTLRALTKSLILTEDEPVYNNKLPLPILDGYIYVSPIEIVRCEADGNYTIFYTIDKKKLVICRTLGIYETILKDQGFIRVHSHHLINIKHVKKYQRGRGGIIFMIDDFGVAVSQRKKEEVLKALNSKFQE